MGTRADELPVTSSVPVKLPEAQETLFREVLLRLEEERLPFTLSRAVALQQHTGICRFTKGLDIFLSPADANAALPILARQGFECEVQDPVWLQKEPRDGFFFYLITGIRKGAISGEPGR